MPKTQIKLQLRQGIEKGFNLDEKGGVIDLMKAIELDREDPLGYACLSLFSLFFYEMRLDEKERERDQVSMQRFVSEALLKGEKRVEKDPGDADAYFAMALARLVTVRLEISRKRYFAMTQETRNILADVEKVKEIDPENYDVYFILGLLHYHLDLLPAFTRFLSSLLITSGDRQKGLEEIELSAKKGYLLKELSHTELSSAYYYFEKQPSRALPIARELKEKFPRNYNFLFSMANIFSDLGRFEEAFSSAREIENGIKSGKPPYRPELRTRYNQLMGKIHFDQGDYGAASQYFNQVITDTAPFNSRIRVWALIRLGMIHDLRKERNQAEEYYRKALEMEGGEGMAQIDAKQYLRTPYSPKEKEIKPR